MRLRLRIYPIFNIEGEAVLTMRGDPPMLAHGLRYLMWLGDKGREKEFPDDDFRR
jgi:hypothetical protein